jgi:hypothetical protein
MNDINLMNVPADERIFCLTNYRAVSEVVDKDGKSNYIDLPRLEPIFAKSLKEAKSKLAEMVGVNPDLFNEWQTVGEEDGFTPSICTGYKVGASFSAGYHFDVYTTVNTLYLV